MKEKYNNLEDKGWYWVYIKYRKLMTIGWYQKEHDQFLTIQGVFSSNNCEIKSDIILRPTE